MAESLKWCYFFPSLETKPEIWEAGEDLGKLADSSRGQQEAHGQWSSPQAFRAELNAGAPAAAWLTCQTTLLTAELDLQ